MDKQYVIITEIYFEGKKISRERIQKEELNLKERNQIIRTIYNEIFGKMKRMDIYSYISIFMKEKHGVEISERTIMRIIEEHMME
jgi:hypothetical protein